MAKLDDHDLRDEIEELRVRLAEAEGALLAIRSGAVDAIVVETSAGEQFFMLNGADTPYREMVETMSEGAVTVGTDGIVLYSNRRFAEMAKVELHTVIGSSLFTYCANEDAASIAAAIRHSANGVPRIRAVLVASDATRVPVNMAMRCHPTYGTERTAIIVTDLTKWQQAFDLAQANKVLEATNRELESFSYSVSHDLRAPLRAVHGFASILLEDYSDRVGEDGRRMLGMVCDGASRMGRMIDDILEFCRVGRSAMAVGLMNMNELVGLALEDLAPLTKDRTVEFRIATLPQAYGDGRAMKRVWVNLLENAIKYSAPTKNATIEIGAREGDEGSIFFVKDNGVGFDMQYAGRLFGLFQRLHSADQFPGTGVGLAIVQRIVTRNGGRLWIEAEPEKGATVFFALPAGKEHYERVVPGN